MSLGAGVGEGFLIRFASGLGISLGLGGSVQVVRDTVAAILDRRLDLRQNEAIQRDVQNHEGNRQPEELGRKIGRVEGREYTALGMLCSSLGSVVGHF